ncbi:MAG TPA: hypothetical protein VLX44_00445 [Xanthobacteraceae bacterium]|nr:hypothetical protein [Xanthobacteraceae bacterium]
MRSFAALVVVVLAALVTMPAQATVRITDDMGGLMTEYASRFASLRASGEKVVIDGPCYSACTMLLGMLSRDQVCVTPNAVLGFHAAWNFDDSGRRVTSVGATQELIDIYPQLIRSWIARRGGLSPHMKFLRGRELAALYPMCGSGAARTETTRAAHNHAGRTWRNVAISASARSASGR